MLSLWFRQLSALCIKSLIVSFRHWKGLVAVLLVPVIIALAMRYAADNMFQNEKSSSRTSISYKSTEPSFLTQPTTWTDLSKFCEATNVSAKAYGLDQKYKPSFNCVRLWIAPEEDTEMNHELVSRLVDKIRATQKDIDVVQFSELQDMSNEAYNVAVEPFLFNSVEVQFTFLVAVSNEDQINVGTASLAHVISNFDWKYKNNIDLKVPAIAAAVHATMLSMLAQIDTSGPLKHIISRPLAMSDLDLKKISELQTVETNVDGFTLIPVIIWTSFWSLGFLFFTLLATMRILGEKRVGLLTHLRQLGTFESTYWLSHWFTLTLFAILPAIAIEAIIALVPMMKDIWSESFSVMRLIITWSTMAALIAMGLFFAAPLSRPAPVNALLSLYCIAVIVSLYFLSTVPIRLDYAIIFAPWLASVNVMRYSLERSRFVALEQLMLDPKLLKEAKRKMFETLVSDGETLQFLVISIVFYLLLTWYLAQVMADINSGFRRPVLFFLDANYWKISTGKPRSMEESGPISSHDSIGRLQQQSSREASIILHKLSKVYGGDGGGSTAVKEFSLHLKCSQIYALLGSNGCGKTSLVKMISGASQPSHGKAFVFGHAVDENVSEVHAMLSICSQEDILWDEMTAFEHIRLFIELRGGFYSVCDKAGMTLNDFINEKLNEVGLLQAAHRTVGGFSGGMRRRLSVLLACLPQRGPGLTILDEPCTGVDAVNRRRLWRLIQRVKQHRVVLLTTHDLYEAEALGDHICIMNRGSLKASGSALFLKNNYGTGFQVRVSQVQRENPHEVCETPNELVQRIVPSAQIVSEMAGVLTVAIDRSHIGQMRALFDALQKFGPHRYEWNVSNTTLEQVFLRLCEAQRHVVDEAQAVAAAVEEDSSNDAVTRALQATRPKCASCHLRQCDEVHLFTGQQIEIVMRDIVCQDCVDNMEKYAMKVDEQNVPVADEEEKTPLLDEVKLPEIKQHEEQSQQQSILLQAPTGQRPVTSNNDPMQQRTSVLFQPLQQINAIAKKNFVIQTRQRRTNICLIVMNIILLILMSVIINFAGSKHSPFSMKATYKSLSRLEVIDHISALMRGCVRNAQQAEQYDDDNSRIFILPCHDTVPSSFTAFVSPSISLNRNFYKSFASIKNDTGMKNGEPSYLNRYDELPTECKKEFEKEKKSDFYWSSNEYVLHPPIISLVKDEDDNVQLNHFRLLKYSSIAAFVLLSDNTCKISQVLSIASTSNEWKISLLIAANAFNPKKQVAGNLAYVDYVDSKMKFDRSSMPANYLPSLVTYLIMIMMLPMSSIMYVIAIERNERLLDLMRLGGLQWWTYWLGNYLFHFVFLLVPSILIIVLLKVFSSVMLNSDNLGMHILLLLLWQHFVIGLSYFLTMFIPKLRRVTIVGILMTIVIPIISQASVAIDRVDANHSANLLIRLLVAPAAFSDAWILVALNRSAPLSTALLFVWGSFLLFVTVCGHPVLEWISGKLSSFTKKTVTKSNTDADAESATLDQDVLNESNAVVSRFYKEDEVAVLTRQLTKQHAGSDRPVLNDVSFAIGYGEVFGLLGPNGAGKSTLLNMIQGLLEPSAGELFVAGHNVSVNGRQALTRLIGVCPQYDALWSDLTVQEHLLIHARLRGATAQNEMIWVHHMAELIDLDGDSLLTRSSQLSGGQKRRLSIGIALLGQSPIILLDEPTSGVDVESRQHIWRLVDQLRQSHRQSIVLTTHAMEEAEALCTRIGIVAGGQLRCLGTTPHLKRRFGERGYTLRVLLHMKTIVNEPNVYIFGDIRVDQLMAAEQLRLRQVQSSLLTHLGWQVDITDTVVEQDGPRHRIQGSVQNREASWLLQYDLTLKVNDLDYSRFFEHVDVWQRECGVLEWALHQSSLEDVFCRLVREYVME